MAVDRSWKYASNCGAARRDQLNAWTDFRHIAVFLNASIEAIGLKECRGHLPGCWCTKMISHSTDQRATWPLACGLRRPPKENAKPSGGLCAPEGTRLEIKGALLDPHGPEVVPCTKILRRLELHRFGFS